LASFNEFIVNREHSEPIINKSGGKFLDHEPDDKEPFENKGG
jgi:hypothetical protein